MPAEGLHPGGQALELALLFGQTRFELGYPQCLTLHLQVSLTKTQANDSTYFFETRLAKSLNDPPHGTGEKLGGHQTLQF